MDVAGANRIWEEYKAMQSGMRFCAIVRRKGYDGISVDSDEIAAEYQEYEKKAELLEKMILDGLMSATQCCSECARAMETKGEWEEDDKDIWCTEHEMGVMADMRCGSYASMESEEV